MTSAKFSIKESTRGVLFSPIDKEAIEMCDFLRRRNLTMFDLEYFLRKGMHIVLVSYVPLSPEVFSKVEYRPLEYVLSE